MKVVAISDTHSMHSSIFGGLPHGDILIHAGDFCGRSDKINVGVFLEWFARRKHEHKIFISGNHDKPFQEDPQWCQEILKEIDPNIIYLQDSGCEVNGIKFWGSPWQPEFFDWAFNLPRGPIIKEKWDLIPNDTDVLITHGPPDGILDLCPDINDYSKMVHVGCSDLMRAVRRVNPKYHIFGHVHEGYGTYSEGGTTFINASSLDGRYKPKNPAIAFDI
jgi:Icc-related predicted phosphoesterase